MYKWILTVVLVAVYGQLGYGAPPCDTMQEFFTTYSNCSMSLYGQQASNKTDFINNLKSICSTKAATFATCMTNQYSKCTSDVKDVVVKGANNYKNRMCDGTNFKPAISSLLSTMGNLFQANHTTTCFSQSAQAQSELALCYYSGGFDDAEGRALVNSSIPRGLKVVGRYYRRMLTCFRRVLRAHSTCTADEIKSMLAYYMILYPIADIREQDLLAATNAKPRKGKRVTVAVFGDPHIAQFNETKLQTCSAPGEQIYLENDFIIISANNSLVRPNGKATVIKKLKIQLMDKAGKVKAKFTAENSHLPNSFDGGKDKIKIDDHEAEVSEKNKRIKIKIPSAGLVIFIIRYKDMYPLVMIRGSESLFNSSSGLLIDGCVETVSRKISRRKRDAACDAACASGNSEQEECCKFDCTETGDKDFAKTTLDGYTEAEKEAAEEDKEMADDFGGGATAATMSGISMVIMLVFALIMS
jgi:hypothetical protein